MPSSRGLDCSLPHLEGSLSSPLPPPPLPLCFSHPLAHLPLLPLPPARLSQNKCPSSIVFLLHLPGRTLIIDEIKTILCIYIYTLSLLQKNYTPLQTGTFKLPGCSFSRRLGQISPLLTFRCPHPLIPFNRGLSIPLHGENRSHQMDVPLSLLSLCGHLHTLL